MGFVLRVLDASEISRNMLRNEPYNLNAMSHDAAIQMIQAVLDAGVKIDTAYIDTVGIADSYRQKLEREFSGHNIKFIVEKKADANYPPCSAASVVAKVSRDSILENWTYSEPEYEAGNNNKYGSGYPSECAKNGWKRIYWTLSFAFPILFDSVGRR
jgi:ribonuclease H2 subunit A